MDLTHPLFHVPTVMDSVCVRVADSLAVDSAVGDTVEDFERFPSWSVLVSDKDSDGPDTERVTESESEADAVSSDDALRDNVAREEDTLWLELAEAESVDERLRVISGVRESDMDSVVVSDRD